MAPDHSKDVSLKLRALIADDDPIGRQLISARLTSMGCECEEAEDGIHAWHAIMSNSFDIAIVDLNMPNLDGVELTRCARNHPRTKHMPIVVVTSSYDKNSIELALSAGATSYLMKPVNWTTFASHVEYLLKLSSASHDARKKIRHIEATDRVKDAVLGTILSESDRHARTILSEIDGLLQSPELVKTSTHVTDALQKLLGAARGLQGAVTKASSVATTISETVTVEDRMVASGSIMQNLHTAMSTTAAAHDVELVFFQKAENPLLRCDQKAIGEAMMQLVANAIKFSRAGQAVKISYSLCPDGEFILSVVDDGVGMRPAHVAKVLSPLSSDHNENEDHGSTGLGLPIAKAIAEAHGGSFDIRSTPNQGTEASITLPPERVVILEEHDAA